MAFSRELVRAGLRGWPASKAAFRLIAARRDANETHVAASSGVVRPSELAAHLQPLRLKQCL